MSIASEPVTTISPERILSAPRPFYWSVRREIWEYRSLYIAPLVAAGLVLFGFFIRILRLPQTLKMLNALNPNERHLALAAPFGIAAITITVAGLIVAFFYCLGALYNERKDRSILFWKSLPVSNATVVLSKAAIPFLVLPAILFAIIIALHLIIFVVGSAVLASTHMDPAILWASWPLIKMSLVLIYGLVVLTLWYAPLYGWIIFVSSWARNMPILWAVLPPLGLCLAERIALGTSYLNAILNDRFNGYLHNAFYFDPHNHEIGDPFALLTPGRYLAAPGLWIGLIVTIGLLGCAIWLRRNREPI